jgi:hypothetical protein
MKLIETRGEKSSFGSEFIVSILKGRRYSAVQVSLYWSNSSDWPYLQISFGMGRIFDMIFSAGKFSGAVDLCGRNWPVRTDGKVPL